VKPISDRVLTAMFCDDIRQEVGNKMSFMGCYQSELCVPTAPMTLPKLCIYLTLMTPTARPLHSLCFKVLLDDDRELARVQIPNDAFSHALVIHEGNATRTCVSAAVVFSPFTIEKSGVVRVLADTDEGEVVGPRLLLKITPQLDPTASPIEEGKLAKLAAKKAAPRKSHTRKPGPA
jgi:hypothetical protein